MFMYKKGNFFLSWITNPQLQNSLAKNENKTNIYPGIKVLTSSIRQFDKIFLPNPWTSSSSIKKSMPNLSKIDQKDFLIFFLCSMTTHFWSKKKENLLDAYNIFSSQLNYVSTYKAYVNDTEPKT